MTATDWRLAVYASGQGSTRSRPPPKAERERILAEQGDRCFYCDLPFGSIVSRGLRSTLLRVTWDHALPFALSGRNVYYVAACQVCNNLKATSVFETAGQAIDAVRARRLVKGYEP